MIILNNYTNSDKVKELFGKWATANKEQIREDWDDHVLNDLKDENTRPDIPMEWLFDKYVNSEQGWDELTRFADGFECLIENGVINPDEHDEVYETWKEGI